MYQYNRNVTSEINSCNSEAAMLSTPNPSSSKFHSSVPTTCKSTANDDENNCEKPYVYKIYIYRYILYIKTRNIVTTKNRKQPG